MLKKSLILVGFLLCVSACQVFPPNAQEITANKESKANPSPQSLSTTPTAPKIPAFDHIIIIMLENQPFSAVIGNKEMPGLNRLASQNVLLTRYYAVAHPSLPNYIALIGGSTFGINSDCTDCFLNKPSLPDLIEASGRTWKTYQEEMPSPCFSGSTEKYAQKHNPFAYFDPIRNDPARCKESVVPLPMLDQDLESNHLPNYAFIMPDLCNSAHDCSLSTADSWLGQMVQKLRESRALGDHYLIFITFDESRADDSSCCGLSTPAGGRVAGILISPQARSGIQDDTPLSHYSLLKTILTSWQLPDLGETARAVPILMPWK